MAFCPRIFFQKNFTLSESVVFWLGEYLAAPFGAAVAVSLVVIPSVSGLYYKKSWLHFSQ
tara:strand:- start:74 stop:253 length:180 start_codon:yes stop_codon:yes gene_type:complete